jgi:hypothetical protein
MKSGQRRRGLIGGGKRRRNKMHMLMDGEDPYKVAKLLGDTLATAERVYGHYDVDYLKTDSSLG